MSLKTPDPIQSLARPHAVATLLHGLIDYAGLFPPASLAMSIAFANYAKYSRSEYNWILGRFILPVTRLGEFEKALEEESVQTPAQSPAASPATKPRWSLSLLPGPDISADLLRIREFNDRFAASYPATKVGVQSLEIKAASPEDIDHLSAIIPREFETYFEIPYLIPRVSTLRPSLVSSGEPKSEPAVKRLIKFLRLRA